MGPSRRAHHFGRKQLVGMTSTFAFPTAGYLRNTSGTDLPGLWPRGSWFAAREPRDRWNFQRKKWLCPKIGISQVYGNGTGENPAKSWDLTKMGTFSQHFPNMEGAKKLRAKKLRLSILQGEPAGATNWVSQVVSSRKSRCFRCQQKAQFEAELCVTLTSMQYIPMILWYFRDIPIISIKFIKIP